MQNDPVHVTSISASLDFCSPLAASLAAAACGCMYWQHCFCARFMTDQHCLVGSCAAGLRLVATKLALTLYRIDIFGIFSLEVMGNNIGLTMGHMNRDGMRRGGVFHRDGILWYLPKVITAPWHEQHIALSTRSTVNHTSAVIKCLFRPIHRCCCACFSETYPHSCIFMPGQE